MNKKRYLLVGSAGVAACAAAVIILSLMSLQPGVTKPNFERVEIGMTRAEVSGILGEQNSPTCEYAWVGETGTAVLDFDDDSRVQSKVWVPSRDDRTAWEKVVDRLLRRKYEPAVVITR
jgi:hypothetical protein